MKKSKIFLTSLIIIAALVSCNKGGDPYYAEVYDLNGNLTNIPIITDGPNVACEDLAAATGCSFPYSSGKIDYSGGTGGTVGPITWTTDGTYVNWTSTKGVKVAFIIKGGPGARLYFSGCNACETSGTLPMSAPINPNTASPYGLSNITICYDLCEVEEELVIAVKAWYWEAGFTPTEADFAPNWGLSAGELAFPGNLSWCLTLGYNSYLGSSFGIVDPYTGNTIANITYSAGQVIVTATEGRTLDRTMVYIGTLEDLQNNNLDGDCPVYTNPEVWMINTVNGSSQSFLAP